MLLAAVVAIWSLIVEPLSLSLVDGSLINYLQLNSYKLNICLVSLIVNLHASKIFEKVAVSITK